MFLSSIISLGMKQLHVAITGANGQLGMALQKALVGCKVVALVRPAGDITNRPTIQQALEQAQPDVVINCAAYTNVDGAAKDPSAAYLVNGHGAQNVALACHAIGADLVHVSTNEVFAGDCPAGYDEWDTVKPSNPYGNSKAAGEFHVRSVLPNHYIVRTAWLYAPDGRNFIHTILRVARTKGQLRVVTDEIGNPTYAKDVATAIAQLITTKQYGTYHFVNSGVCSRWAFANEILRLANLDHVSNKPILGNEFKRASTPPKFATLNNNAGAALGLTLRPWQEALADCLKSMNYEG